MLIIKFSVYNQRLRRITSGIIPSNAYGKLKFEFDFRTDDWTSVAAKMANFYYKGENYPVKLDENDQCFVPKEVIYAPSFSVSVHGGDIVTNYVKNPVETVKSSPTPTPPGGSDTTTGVVFVPHINEDKILSWTVKEGIDGTEVIPPVDLNPFDEWSEDGDIVSEYEWEDDF
jgi:hypothetical protein